jgi:hypothetical protein
VSDVPDAIDVAQQRLMRGARDFVAARVSKGRDVAFEPECYMTAWARTPGFARLQRIAHGWRAEPARLLARARDGINSMRESAFAVSGEVGAATGFRHLIVSWALPGDFDAEGHYQDRYLGLSTRESPATLWLLLLIEGAPPARLVQNVRVLHHDARGARARADAGAPPSRPRARRFSGIVARAHSVADAVSLELRRAPIRSVIVPYEGQPFQHALMLAAKRQRPNVATLGYMHTVIPAVPTEYIYRSGAPDRLLMNGPGQAEILCQQMGWPPERVHAVQSLRYMRDPEPAYAGCILLPYDCDADVMAGAFERYLRQAGAASMPAWQVRIHPVMISNPRHQALARRLLATVERHRDRVSLRAEVARQTIVFGATAAVIEALERGFDVVHLCGAPLFEKYSAEIWRHLDVQELAPGAYRYRLRSPGAYIRFGRPGMAANLLGIEN